MMKDNSALSKIARQAIRTIFIYNVISMINLLSKEKEANKRMKALQPFYVDDYYYHGIHYIICERQEGKKKIRWTIEDTNDELDFNGGDI